ncbi:TIGR01459 family HAD-type hydrolase [Alsobacter sp. R-9]
MAGCAAGRSGGVTVALAGVAELATRFKVALIDQFGVLHDGSAPYPGAVEALSRLKSAGVRVALLSNSGKRSEPNRRRNVGLGFDPTSWDALVTSGEVAWHILHQRRSSTSRERCYLIARDRDSSAILGLGFDPAPSPAEADLILIAGSEGDRRTLADYAAELEPAARTGVPALCTNPDDVMLTRVGPRFGAGRIAALYRDMGGTVTMIGKPYPEIYRFALRQLGDPPLSDVVAIGDSVAHDIAGARGAGMAAALVLGGVHSLGGDEGGPEPDFTLPAFRW